MSSAPAQEDGQPGPSAPGRAAVERVLFFARDVRDDSRGHSVLRLAREVRRQGIAVELACGGNALAAEFARVGVRASVFSRLAAPRPPWRTPRKLIEHIGSFRPQLLHYFGRSLARWSARLSLLTGLPYVLTVTKFAPSGSRGKVPGDWRLGSVMAVSEELREDLVNRARIPKDAITVIPIGIALQDYERYLEAHGETAVPVVGTVGPLTHERGCTYFVQAAKEVLDRGHKVQFLIAGDGDERGPIHRLIRRLGLDPWVTVTPAFSDYRKMIAVLDLCVISAVREGLGLDIVEAMACRKPVVATGVGPACGLIADGETGFLAPKKDPAAIAEKVCRLLNDPALARRMVDAAYAMVRDRFSVEATTQQLLAFYAKCIEKSEAR